MNFGKIDLSLKKSANMPTVNSFPWLVKIDANDKSSFFTDSARSNPLAYDGQNIGAVNNLGSGGGYATAASGYEPKWFQSAGPKGIHSAIYLPASKGLSGAMGTNYDMSSDGWFFILMVVYAPHYGAANSYRSPIQVDNNNATFLDIRHDFLQTQWTNYGSRTSVTRPDAWHVMGVTGKYGDGLKKTTYINGADAGGGYDSSDTRLILRRFSLGIRWTGTATSFYNVQESYLNWWGITHLTTGLEGRVPEVLKEMYNARLG